MVGLNTSDIFRKVKRHLLTQNARAMKDGSCALRADDGLKCAIGCLIPDELYHQKLDELIIWSKPMMEVLGNSGLGKLDQLKLKLIDRLRAIHDSVAPEDWPSALDDLEVNLWYGLEDVGTDTVEVTV